VVPDPRMARLGCRHAPERSRVSVAVGRTISAELGRAVLPALVAYQLAVGKVLAVSALVGRPPVVRATAVRLTAGRVTVQRWPPASRWPAADSRRAYLSGMRRPRRRPSGPCASAGVSARRPRKPSRRRAYPIHGRARTRRSRQGRRPLSPLPRFPRPGMTQGRKVLRGRTRVDRWGPRGRGRVRLVPLALSPPGRRLPARQQPVRQGRRSSPPVRPRRQSR